MLSKNLRTVTGGIIALLLIVAAYAVPQFHVSQQYALNPIGDILIIIAPTATVQSNVSNTEIHTGSHGKIIPHATALTTTRIVPTALSLSTHKQPPKIKNTKTIKIEAYRESPSGEFNFGRNNIDRYCIYKVQEANKNVSIQRHAEYWTDYIATNLEGMHNISEFEHRYNLTYSNCVKRLTTSTNNSSVKSMGDTEGVLITAG